MGIGRLGYVKYSLWGQNGAVLVFLGPKQRRLSHHKSLFVNRRLLRFSPR